MGGGVLCRLTIESRIHNRKESGGDSLNKLHVHKKIKSEGSNNGNSHAAVGTHWYSCASVC